MSWLAIS